MFSNQRVERFDDREPELLQPLADNPRVQQIRGKIRTPATRDGQPVPKMKAFNVRDAIFEALLHRFAIDPTMIAFGEENRDWGGAFAVYRGLTEALPYHRLFNSPISEAAIVGAAVGYALEGGRVVAELMYADFMGRAGDEIFNQLSKWQAMSAGQLTMPVVLRVSVGAKYGAQHSQDFTALVHHIPGLKVVYPVTPYDAKGMMNAALAGPTRSSSSRARRSTTLARCSWRRGPGRLLRDRFVGAFGQTPWHGSDPRDPGPRALHRGRSGRRASNTVRPVD
jgi:2-oxoisovalerate dehydrogenase E1 component